MNLKLKFNLIYYYSEVLRCTCSDSHVTSTTVVWLRNIYANFLQYALAHLASTTTLVVRLAVTFFLILFFLREACSALSQAYNEHIT